MCYFCGPVSTRRGNQGKGKVKKLPNKPADIGRLARKAAAIINDRGWIRGSLQNADGNVCIMGAMGIAWNGNAISYTKSLPNASRTLGVYFHDSVPEHGQVTTFFAAETFNDQVFESKEEVISWLNKAADHLDPKGA